MKAPQDTLKMNWAQRRKLALEKLGDNLLATAEKEALAIQARFNMAIKNAIEHEFRYLPEDELNLRKTLQALFKSFPEDKPISATVDLALEKLARKISCPLNPFGE